MRVVQQPQRLSLQAMNDVLLAPQERMMMQTAVDGATLLQQQAIYYGPSVRLSVRLSHGWRQTRVGRNKPFSRFMRRYLEKGTRYDQSYY